MPDIIVKLWPGKSEKKKCKLAEVITQSVMNTLHDSEESVPVAFQEIQSKNWARQVYQIYIVDHEDELYKNRATQCEFYPDKLEGKFKGDTSGNHEDWNAAIR